MDTQVVVGLVWLLTFLLPVNGIILLGMIRERKKRYRIMLQIWSMQRGKMGRIGRQQR